MARYLALIVSYLMSRVGEEVLEWSVRQLISYFRNNPEVGEQCSAACQSDWVKEANRDNRDFGDHYYWELKNRANDP